MYTCGNRHWLASECQRRDLKQTHSVLTTGPQSRAGSTPAGGALRSLAWRERTLTAAGAFSTALLPSSHRQSEARALHGAHLLGGAAAEARPLVEGYRHEAPAGTRQQPPLEQRRARRLQSVAGEVRRAVHLGCGSVRRQSSVTKVTATRAASTATVAWVTPQTRRLSGPSEVRSLPLHQGTGDTGRRHAWQAAWIE